MRVSALLATALLLLSLPHYTLQWSLPNEIRGIHSKLLTEKQKSSVLESLAKYQQTAGDTMTVVGFLTSTYDSLVANQNIVQKILGGINSLQAYLKDSDVQSEINQVQNPRLPDNLAILGVIQKTIIGGKDRRDTLLSEMSVKELTERFSLEEAAR